MRTIDYTEIDRWLNGQQQSEESYIKPASSFADEVVDLFHGEQQRGTSLGWQKAEGHFDLRPSEVSLWMGYNGHGKTLLLSQAMLAVMEQGQRVVIASFEMRPAATMARMTRQASQGAKPSVDYIHRFHKQTDGKLWIYDEQDLITPERIVAMARYCREVLKADHIVIDSLMKVVHDEEDFGAVKRFVNELCVLARNSKTHIHLVHHARKGADESRIPGKYDARGSSVISDLVDNCVVVWRRKEKADAEQSDCVLSIDKQRHGEWEGRINLWFHPASQQYTEGAKWPAKEFRL